MSTVLAPCGEKMSITEWTRHMIRCRKCMFAAAAKRPGAKS